MRAEGRECPGFSDLAKTPVPLSTKGGWIQQHRGDSMCVVESDAKVVEMTSLDHETQVR